MKVSKIRNGKASAAIAAILVSAAGIGLGVGISSGHRSSVARYRLVGPIAPTVTADGSEIALVTPPVLPISDGLSLGSDWTAYGTEGTQTIGVASTSGAPVSGKPSAADVGLVGDALQTWVVSAALSGSDGTTAIQLPLSASFDNSVSGPTELFVTEYEFTDNATAQSYFSRIDYATQGWGNPITNLANPYGDMTQVSSNEPGESVFNVQWVSGGFVVNVSAWGGSGLTSKQTLETVFPVSISGTGIYAATNLPWQ